MPHKTPTILKISVLALAVSFTFDASTAFAQWTPPTVPPPNGNVSAPINTSTSTQTKTGGLLSVFNLWVDQTLSVIGGIATGGANIEHTAYGTGNRYSYIDFHGDDTYTDYGLRLLRANSGPNAGSVLSHRGTGTLYIEAQDAGGSISLRQNSADRLYVNSAGNVGIGTTAPGAKLDVSQTTAGAIGSLISMPTAAENTAPGIRVHGYSPAIELLDKDNVQNWYMGIDDNDANKLLFGRGYGPGQGVAPSIVIDTTGNVGIGTATPSYKLSVAGDIINTNADGQLGASSDKVFRDTGDNWLRLRTAAGGGTYADLAVGNLYTSNSALFASSNGIWDSAGKVGIGTIAPNAKLQAGTSPNYIGLEPRTDGMAIGGINAANAARVGGFYSTNPVPGAAIHFGAQGAGGQRGAIAFLTKVADDNTTQPSAKMVIDQNGNVGIGTTAPALGVKLDVNGTLKMGAVYMTPGAGNGKVLTSDSSGNGYWANQNPLASVDTNGSWTWTNLVNNRSYTNSSGSSYYQGYTLDASRPVLGFRMSGTANWGGGMCVAGVSGYIAMGITRYAYISDLDIGFGSWSGMTWSSAGSPMPTTEWFFETLPPGRFGVDTIYGYSSAYNKSAGFSAIPSGRFLWTYQYSYPGSTSYCTIDVLYGAYL